MDVSHKIPGVSSNVQPLITTSFTSNHPPVPSNDWTAGNVRGFRWAEPVTSVHDASLPTNRIPLPEDACRVIALSSPFSGSLSVVVLCLSCHFSSSLSPPKTPNACMPLASGPRSSTAIVRRCLQERHLRSRLLLRLSGQQALPCQLPQEPRHQGQARLRPLRPQRPPLQGRQEDHHR